MKNLTEYDLNCIKNICKILDKCHRTDLTTNLRIILFNLRNEKQILTEILDVLKEIKELIK
jgi:hypothetical protein